MKVGALEAPSVVGLVKGIMVALADCVRVLPTGGRLVTRHVGTFCAAVAQNGDPTRGHFLCRVSIRAGQQGRLAV